MTEQLPNNESILEGEGFKIDLEGNLTFDSCSFRRIEKIKPPWHKRLSIWIQRLFYSKRKIDARLVEAREKHLREVADKALLRESLRDQINDTLRHQINSQPLTNWNLT